jgi:hypothetical protein
MSKIIECDTDEEYLELEARASVFLNLPRDWMERYAPPPEDTDRKFEVIPAVAHLFEDQSIVEGELPQPPEPPEPSEQEGD